MNVKQNLFVAFALLMLLPLTAGAKPRAKADMKKIAARAINLQTTLNSNKTNAPASSAARNAGQLRELKHTKAYLDIPTADLPLSRQMTSHPNCLAYQNRTIHKATTPVSTGG